MSEVWDGMRTPAEQLASMLHNVAVIDDVISGTYPSDPPQGLTELVAQNVRHLELMVGPRVDDLGDSPDLSTYQAAITAGNAYVAS